jgi:hypothetical protein
MTIDRTSGHAAFGQGFVDYEHRRYHNPFDGVAAQAWNRGHEARCGITDESGGAG